MLPERPDFFDRFRLLLLSLPANLNGMPIRKGPSLKRQLLISRVQPEVVRHIWQ
jgi:hypothetical protein